MQYDLDNFPINSTTPENIGISLLPNSPADSMQYDLDNLPSCTLGYIILQLSTQARESQFFSKATRYVDTATQASPAKEELPPVKKEEPPFQYKPDNGNGYGLYGHGPEKLPPAATANPSTSTYNYNNVGESLNAENSPSEFPNNEHTGVSYENKDFNNAAGYPDNSNYANNKATAYNAGSIPDSEFNSGSYSKYNKEPNTRYPTYSSEREQYGMSDTRFLENGKYFYDMNAEDSYRNGRYDPARGNPRAYGSFGGGASSANEGYSYGNSNKGNRYEENTSTQGYQSNQNTQENQEEYTP